jgi:predicted nucleic acid-binding protein
MNALIDTNVILDAIMGRVPFNKAAESVLLLAANEDFRACVTASSITDIDYILRKHMQDGEQAKQAIRKIMTIVAVLDVTAVDCEKALVLPLKDYEDALQAQCAKRNNMSCIVTRDMEHFRGSPVKAVMPEEFIKSI